MLHLSPLFLQRVGLDGVAGQCAARSAAGESRCAAEHASPRTVYVREQSKKGAPATLKHALVRPPVIESFTLQLQVSNFSAVIMQFFNYLRQRAQQEPGSACYCWFEERQWWCQLWSCCNTNRYDRNVLCMLLELGSVTDSAKLMGLHRTNWGLVILNHHCFHSRCQNRWVVHLELLLSHLWRGLAESYSHLCHFLLHHPVHWTPAWEPTLQQHSCVSRWVPPFPLPHESETAQEGNIWEIFEAQQAILP